MKRRLYYWLGRLSPWPAPWQFPWQTRGMLARQGLVQASTGHWYFWGNRIEPRTEP